MASDKMSVMTLSSMYKLLFNIVFISFLLVSTGLASATDAVAEEAERRAVLGINIADGRDSGGPVEGVTVVGVAPGGAADDAGLKVDDVIVEIGAVSLMAASEQEANQTLLDFMTDIAPGDELGIIYLRDGKSGETTLTAEALDPAMMVEPGFPFIRDLERLGRQLGDEFIEPFRWRHHGLFAGMELVAVTPELGRYFGTDYGLLVIRAPTDAVIDLQDGDVIREIGGRTPKDPGHAMRILRSYEPGEEVLIGIMRDQRDHDVAIVFPEREEDAVSETG